MAGRKGKTGGGGRGKGKAPAIDVPDVYQEMLAEVLPSQAPIPDRPFKKRRTALREVRTTPGKSIRSDDADGQDEDEGSVEFEDIIEHGVDAVSSSKPQQTAYRDSDEDSVSVGSEYGDIEWEGIDFEPKPDSAGPSRDLELTLTKKEPPKLQLSTSRRRTVTKAERIARVEIHKMHILCLLSYLDRRNNWCNDSDVQKSLKPLLDKKMLIFLRPKSSLSQFEQTNSLKRGLEQVLVMWREKFKITARGMRRSLWADNENDLVNYRLPDDADAVFDISDFREAAKTLKGSRDIAAQLYCALLRCAGVETRLVCSLQPLSFTVGGPPMPRAPKPPVKSKSEIVKPSQTTSNNSPSKNGGNPPMSGNFLNPRSRLGHPNAADYNIPEIKAPQPPRQPKPKPIITSPFPVFWVEVFDEAHQKWFPVDLVTESIARPRILEPPAIDKENNMSYVIAFEEDGSARDVTRRYTKAYNAKTRKSRVESTPGGEKWWKKTMRTYGRGFKSDADQIEDSEFAAISAKEPMPKNITDFKDHPYYALERHMRRNEVLVSTHEVGKVAAGRDSNTPGGKKMESVYRRRDVKVARSADAWYRQGREVKIGQQPIKTVAARRKPDEDGMGDEEELAEINLYTEDQTQLYEPPPIVNGRVPKNSFGNLDIFVPTMVPKGGVHIPHPEASRAAKVLGIDYADALMGFEFRGRHGTAVLKGIIVASEYREAVEAVIEGFRDERAAMEEQMRSHRALRMWKRFLISLRIKERIDGYAVEGEDEPEEVAVPDDEDDDDSGMDEEYVDEGGGGFFPDE